MNKQGFEFSFSWIFAMIIGVAILALAIYGVTRFIANEQTLQDAKTVKEIGVLLNPLETGFESFKTTTVTFPVETRIYNKCSLKGFFGQQLIQISQKSFGEWTKTDLDVSFPNKYIYSEVPIEEKKFILFSKPFKLPFKVADLIYMIPKNKYYCFKNAPENIQEEVENLNIENVRAENCSLSRGKKVCFGGGGECDILVSYDKGKGLVKKKEQIMSFEQDSLMYAAIFSNELEYECQLKRLMKRVGSLTDLYKSKETFISRAGCQSDFGNDLTALKNMATALKSSGDLGAFSLIVEKIEDKNSNNWECRLW